MITVTTAGGRNANIDLSQAGWLDGDAHYGQIVRWTMRLIDADKLQDEMAVLLERNNKLIVRGLLMVLKILLRTLRPLMPSQ